MTRSGTSTGNITKIRVTVALFTSKNVNISRALHSSLLPLSVLIGFLLPVQSFVDRMSNLRQSLIRGVFQRKASSSWAGNKIERIKSLCACPKILTRYEAVYTAYCMARYRDVSHMRTDFTPMAPAPPSSVQSWL